VYAKNLIVLEIIEDPQPHQQCAGGVSRPTRRGYRGAAGRPAWITVAWIRAPMASRGVSGSGLFWKLTQDWSAAMSITIDVSPEVEAELARQATSQGRAIEAVAADLLEAAVHLPEVFPARASAENLMELFQPVRGLLTNEEVDIIFRRNASTARPIDLS
jgi:hypothetical protein